MIQTSTDTTLLLPLLPGKALRVLVADDDPDTRDAVEAAVKSFGHTCVAAGDGLEAWEMHQRERADIVLCDWEMPRMTGLDLCLKIRGDDPSLSYTHFIFVTGNGDKRHFIEGMHAGADDYIAKPVDIDELEARIEAARRVVMLHRQLEAHNSLLRRDSERAFIAARTDPLTLAFNRRALQEDLEALTARATRYRHRYCAALCDIDDFKAYNDGFGHIAGDDALRRVAQTIHEQLRRGDSFYRYGGEEFLAILPEQTLIEAAAGMDRVRQAVEALHIPQAPAARVPFVTISVGISELNANSKGAVDGWLQRTDTALYSAKGLGRNRVEVEAAV